MEMHWGPFVSHFFLRKFLTVSEDYAIQFSSTLYNNHTTVTDHKPSFEFIKSTFVQASDLLFNELTLCFTLICFIGQINRWFVYPYNCTFQSFLKAWNSVRVFNSFISQIESRKFQTGRSILTVLNRNGQLTFPAIIDRLIAGGHIDRNTWVECSCIKVIFRL